MTRILLALALTIGADPADQSKSANWPQFRGPNGSGVAAEGPPLPVRFGPNENVLWKTALPLGHSSPCVWGDRIFVTGFDREAKKLETLALDRRTGQIVWRQPAPATAMEKVHENSNPATATPATDGERVYVFFASCGVLCYDFAGKELWKLPLPMPRTRFGTGTSPVVVGDIVLLSVDYPPKPAMIALNRRTGETVWKKEHAAFMEGYATPVVWSHDGEDEVIVHGSSKISALSLKDGEEKWWVTVMSNACATPVVGGGRLFASTWMINGEPSDRVEVPSFDDLLKKYDKDKDGMISKDEFPADLSFLRRADAGDIPGADVKIKPFFDSLDANKDGKISRLEWAMVEMFMKRPVEHGLFAIKPGGKGDATSTHVVWRDKKGAPEVPSPLYYRGRVYQVRDGGIVSCVDAETGKLVYRERLGPTGAFFSSPVAGDGKIYAASLRGVVVVFDAGDKLNVLSRNDLGQTVAATPALVDGIVYVRTDKHLYAFGQPSAKAQR
ncbi:MAG TPA: PQQ-binding-like beta-propeller repeat protein [Gemmataceae bacterium]|jgi:outer membrane protein assembly factor BamB|nr:PQQ-binding-like beta-propeller repeat protein [Gemmataceae bacterium]